MKLPTGLFLIFLTIAASSVATAQDVDSLVILTEEYPPYNYMDNGEVRGTATEYLMEILGRIGSRHTRQDIRLMPWARAYNQVLNAKNTILFVMTRTAEREDVSKWVCPVGVARIGVIARKEDDVVINRPEDFEKYRIGVVREDIGHQLMRNLIPERDLDITNSSESNLRKLKAGRIDLFVYDVQVADFVLSHLGLDADKYESVYILEESPLCIAFNKDTDDSIIRTFQETLDEILKEKQLSSCP